MKITTASETMRLAVRRQGVKPSEVADLLGSRPSDVAKTMRSLEARGYLRRETGTKKHANRIVAYCTKAQQNLYFDAPAPKPKPPKTQKAAKNITFCAPVIVRHSVWDKNAPAHYPVDAEGRPLYKITVAPPPPQPLKTNTFAGAY